MKIKEAIEWINEVKSFYVIENIKQKYFPKKTNQIVWYKKIGNTTIEDLW